MPREKKLSARLDSLLDAVFDDPRDAFSLYGDIAALLRSEQRILTQKKIRKTLRQKGEISTASAVLAACVLHLSGFPAHRILHFLSIYIHGNLNLSLFELAASTIFLSAPPVPSSLLYDITQYTYLEKRLLARKSLEISARLKESLSPELLLYLYLLSLRDDLSNENVQLVALIMKNCFPTQELRTRLGGASLEEYGEIARAWRKAEQRTISGERTRKAGAEERDERPFDWDTASFFLDRYFSDAALEKLRVESPPTPLPLRRPGKMARPEPAVAAADAGDAEDAGVARAVRPAAPSPTQDASPRLEAPLRSQAAPSRSPAAASRPHVAPPRTPAGSQPGSATPRQRRAAEPARSAPATRGRAAALARGETRRAPGLQRSILSLLPCIIAAVALGITLLALRVLPMQVAASSASPAPAAPGPPAASAAVPLPAPAAAEPAPPVAATRTYVVQEGDSLWKIFNTLHTTKPDAKSWANFLTATRTMNGLDDPDRIRPGSVLTLTPPNK